MGMWAWPRVLNGYVPVIKNSYKLKISAKKSGNIACRDSRQANKLNFGWQMNGQCNRMGWWWTNRPRRHISAVMNHQHDSRPSATHFSILGELGQNMIAKWNLFKSYSIHQITLLFFLIRWNLQKSKTSSQPFSVSTDYTFLHQFIKVTQLFNRHSFNFQINKNLGNLKIESNDFIFKLITAKQLKSFMMENRRQKLVIIVHLLRCH